MITNISYHTALSDYNIAENQVDIWQFSLQTPPDLTDFILSDEEKARADRFQFERHRRRFRTARATMRLILAAYLEREAQNLVFQYGKQGKPELVHDIPLPFNLSHSGEMALLAVSKQSQVGIDIEQFSARPYLGIARHSFSAAEVQTLKDTPPYLQAWLFFHIWSQKEAFIKACGMGLSYPTQSFTVNSAPANRQIITNQIQQKDWQLYAYNPLVGFNAALCCDVEVDSIRFINT